MALILAQKAVGVLDWTVAPPRAAGRGGSCCGSAVGELALSTLLAPVIMLRQTVAVASVFARQDCGWKPPAGAARPGDAPWLEPAAGAALLLAVTPGIEAVWPVLLIAPIVLPLFAAPALVAWLDRVPGAPPLRGVSARRLFARPVYAAQAVTQQVYADQRYGHTSDATLTAPIVGGSGTRSALEQDGARAFGAIAEYQLVSADQRYSQTSEAT